ncbi:acyltransferase family protein [Pararhodonellum marinum]|uniref:acyltransferase family protein n=1 Tax=Pararhodonellum marinum TaxID=2755358 RepID=UPI0018907026|nr:acyltransferase family protein [Pararhodonellum marinum]
MRRFDLDWLRVIVFGLLIMYHVGMFFVPWGWHIKNDILYSEIRWPMLFVNQWRLPILFVISGMGTYYALSKRTGRQFAYERVKRLFLPLVVGMLLIVPPQVYFERLDRGQFAGGYFDFWPSQAFIGVYPEGNFSWHHLWFLPYLLLFSLVLIPALLYLRKNPQSGLIRLAGRLASRPFGLFWLVIPLYFWESLVEPFFPSTHALWGDWFNVINYLTLFFYGFLLISVKDIFWKTVEANRRKYLYLGILAFSLMVGLRMAYEDSVIIHFTEASFKVINLWAWILVLFGYAAAYLNRSSSTLSYANEAVYPFYILHQTITIALGFYLMHLPWGFWPKFLLMVLGTFGIAWLLYEFLIRRWTWIRPLFGLKNAKAEKPQAEVVLHFK